MYICVYVYHGGVFENEGKHWAKAKNPLLLNANMMTNENDDDIRGPVYFPPCELCVTQMRFCV